MRGLGQAAAAQEAAEAAARRRRRARAEQLAAAHTVAVRKVQARAFQAEQRRARRVAAAQREFEAARLAVRTAASPQAAWTARDRMAAAQGALNAIWNEVPPTGVPSVGFGSYYSSEKSMSYAGLGQVIPSATVGRDPLRRPLGSTVRVGARWAQRAANAGNRYNNSSAPLIAVDGHAGPVTIAGLRTLSHQFSSDQPVTTDPVGLRVADRVIIPVALEAALATKPIIADPPISTATRRTTSSTTSATPVTTPIPGATPAATPADEVILDEGSSGGGGLIARYGIWPWALGGTVLAGVGIWFLLGGGAGASMRSNRRRVRRNGRSHGPAEAAKLKLNELRASLGLRAEEDVPNSILSQQGHLVVEMEMRRRKAKHRRSKGYK